MERGRQQPLLAPGILVEEAAASLLFDTAVGQVWVAQGIVAVAAVEVVQYDDAETGGGDLRGCDAAAQIADVAAESECYQSLVAPLFAGSALLLLLLGLAKVLRFSAEHFRWVWSPRLPLPWKKSLSRLRCWALFETAKSFEASPQLLLLLLVLHQSPPP